MILNKLLNHRLTSLIVFKKRSLIIKSDFDLGNQMKLLNNKKEFTKALELFDKYKKNNTQSLSTLTITQALKACAQTGDLQRGSTIHQFLSSRFEKNSAIVTSLIHFYMHCGDVPSGQLLFDKSTKKTLFTYGAMMKGYIKNNMPNKAIDLFNQIENPDEVILILFFNACAQLETYEALNLVKNVSSKLQKSSYSDLNLLTSLIDALMKCGDVIHAQSLFDNSTKKTLFMYGAMMKGYIKNNMPNKAIDLFNQTENPDEVIISLLFDACAELKTSKALNLVKNVSSKLPKSSYSNLYLLTSLIDALMKCGDVKYAQSLFDKSTKKILPMFGAMMKGFIINNMPTKAIDLFNQIKEPNLVIYLITINALSQIGILSMCELIVEKIPNCFLMNNHIQNALIDMWGKSGCVDQAKKIFENMSQLDETSYTVMINSYGLNGMSIEAIELFHKVPSHLIQESTYVCVLNACSHSGLVQQARSLFNNIQMKTEKIYTVMIDCLSRAFRFEEAQQLIDQFECDHLPGWSMHMALLSGVRNKNNSHLSQQIVDRMKKLFPQMIDSLNSASILLANVYRSTGQIDKASDIRIQLQQSGVRRTVSVSTTAVNGQLFQFRAHDQSHPQAKKIYAEIEKISAELLEHGHQYDASWITRPLDLDETIESTLCGHSERLAIAWNFVENPHASLIQVTNNLRVCGDCHRATKLIASIRQCEIIVRDANRIHHFYTNGQCSCQDYF
ncbi:unnamed protein product [Adineta steineri]|uniref:DYW domain-containing protein n=2 Tax=Adineta steineri TaxID=433720 RepID=A0A814DNA3_9BILA|nr:unnamed protein product [Adineta steineri]CAF1012586.1 unnamed protein product [Adineta steineri]CAF4101498.1 unnamed protein product [Adineta steineri]